jgi:hypothetical protein
MRRVRRDAGDAREVAIVAPSTGAGRRSRAHTADVVGRLALGQARPLGEFKRGPV